MNSEAIFQLATYAHTQLAPLMDPLDARLQIVMDFETDYPGVEAWVFPNDFKRSLIAHKTGIKYQSDVDELVAEVKALASVAA